MGLFHLPAESPGPPDMGQFTFASFQIRTVLGCQQEKFE